MSPNINKGDLLVIDKKRNESVNDVIVFKYPLNYQQNIAHRIIAKEFELNDYYVTKGDNNITNDPWQLLEEDIIGIKVINIPKIGYPISFIQSEVGLITLVVIPLIILIYSDLEYIFTNLIKAIISFKNGIKKILINRKSR